MAHLKRPVFRYFGGKYRLAPWIIQRLPPHEGYLEPCGGAASILINKPRAKLETYNDIDGNIVNFFRVLRDQPEELIRLIKLTPWARAEFELHFQPTEDSLEAARRFWIGCTMAISCMAFSSSGMRMSKNTEAMPGKVDARLTYDHLYAVAKRLLGVQIENLSYEEAIERYDHRNTLIYFDPPYVTSTRESNDIYAEEWPDSKHRAAAAILHQAQSMIVVSGYDCPLYQELYGDWLRLDKATQANRGERIESLWLSPNIPSSKQISLF